MLRLFVALLLPDSVRTRVCAVQDYLRESIGDEGIRWVPEEQLHYTLKFLGEVQETELDTVCEGIACATACILPWEMTVARIGTFPRRGNPQNLWIGATEGVPVLKKAAEYIDQELKERGFAEEAKEFVPHVTLARMKTREGEEMVAKILPTIETDPLLLADCGTLLVRECLLMQSLLRPGGPIYTPVETFAFGTENEYNR